MKKLLCTALTLATILTLTGCGNNTNPKDDSSSSVSTTEDVTEVTTEEESPDLQKKFNSSEEVILGYWNAFSAVSKEQFTWCFPDVKSKEIESLIEDQYNNAKKCESTISVDSVTVNDSTIYDISKLSLGDLNVEKAELNKVSVYLSQIIDGTTHNVEDNYDIVTVKIDGNWYCYSIEETSVIDLSNEDNEVPDTEEPDKTPGDDTSSSTNSYLTAEVKNAMNDLQTDYNKINWGVEYSPFEDMPGIVVSVSPMLDNFGDPSLLVGVTNLYEEPITITAEGTAKDLNGNANNGDIFIFADSLGSGCTYTNVLHCNEIPSGEIHWDSFETGNSYKTPVYWEGDWSLGGTKDNTTLTYTINKNEEADTGEVMAFALDEKGFVVYTFVKYSSSEDKDVTDSIESYEDLSTYGIKDVALFVNPLKSDF